MAAIEQIFEYAYPGGNQTIDVLISNIPQTYRNLEVIWTGTGSSSSMSRIDLTLNSNASGVYTSTKQMSNQPMSGVLQNLTFVSQTNGNGTIQADTNGANVKLMIYDYANTTSFTQISSLNNTERSQGAFMQRVGTTYKNTAAITSLLFTHSGSAIRGDAHIWINGWNEFSNA